MFGTLAALLRRVNRGCGRVLRVVGLLGLSVLGSCQTSEKTAVSRPGAASAQDAYRRPAELIRALRLVPGQTVAEIGAGGGYLTPYLAEAVGESGKVVSTDIDEAALVALRQRTRTLPQVEVRRVSAAQSGLEPGRYDVILLADVAHLLPHPSEYLPALFPALTKGGRVVVSGRIDRREILEHAATAARLALADLPIELPGQFVAEVRPVR